MKAPPVTADYMREWAGHVHGSPLYAELWEVVARSPSGPGARDGRPVDRVFFGHMHPADAWHTIGIDTKSGETVLGEGHPHGEWVELYARP